MPQGALSTCCTEWHSQRGWLSHRNHIGTIRNGQMQTVVLCRIRHANQRRWKNKSLRIMQTRRVFWCFLGNLEVNPLVDGPMITFKILVVSQLDPCPLKHNWVMLKLVVGDTFCPAHIWTLFQGPQEPFGSSLLHWNMVLECTKVTGGSTMPCYRGRWTGGWRS